MTRADAIASILKRLADAHYQAADELLALASNESGTSVSVSGAEAASSPGAAPPSLPPSIDELPFDDALIPDEFREPQGSEAVCPKHRRPYSEGTYGPYCSSKTDDPAWANKRGYCRISPKNAHIWLRNQAAVA